MYEGPRASASPLRDKPFRGSHLLFGSDYSGDHRGSRFRVYCFVIADADASPEWPIRCRGVRCKFLKDGRRMSFKNLNDIHRRRALVPFLEAAEFLDGHVVGVTVAKELLRLSTGTNTMVLWQKLHGFRAKWDSRAFEQMVSGGTLLLAVPGGMVRARCARFVGNRR